MPEAAPLTTAMRPSSRPMRIPLQRGCQRFGNPMDYIFWELVDLLVQIWLEK
jgi:hypothetical protein